MKNENAYFQPVLRADGVYLALFPGNSDKKPDIHDIEEYLNKKSIAFEKAVVMNALTNLNSVSIVKVNAKFTGKLDETVLVRIAADKSYAEVRFVPPAEQGKTLTHDEIVSEIAGAGVIYGLDEKVLQDFLSNRQYGRAYRIANYLPQKEGKSAFLTYHFNTDLSRKPKQNEDGSVDYHSLELINMVHEGDCIVTMTPAVAGVEGMDVTGHVIKPASVKQMVLRPEKNTKVSEDGLSLISLVNGHVALIDDKIFVSNIYDVPANVDNSTGDIRFDGCVRVRGNVCTGFSIEAGGDVVVDGVVEGARIIAGGQIILKRGIQGMGRGYLQAKGNVLSKFIENAEVKSDGYVSSDTIMHSRVTAAGDVFTTGKKGFIIGGEVHSGATISVKSAGSAMGTPTLLEICADTELLEEYNAIQKRIPELEKELDKLTQLIALFSKKIKSGEKLPADKLLMLKEAMNTKVKYETEIKNSITRMESISELSASKTNGSIMASEVIYPGCKVIMYNIPYYVRTELKYCRLIKDGADVKLTAYS